MSLLLEIPAPFFNAGSITSEVEVFQCHSDIFLPLVFLFNFMHIYVLISQLDLKILKGGTFFDIILYTFQKIFSVVPYL